jgi:hypothetical protein
LAAIFAASVGAIAQLPASPANDAPPRVKRFLAGRRSSTVSAAAAMSAARVQHAAMVEAQTVEAQTVAPRVSPLSAGWQAVGPASVATAAYGNVSGRVTAIAIDPADTTGNTVYVGTTGGGVWKSVNAAGPAASVSFTPLTDTLPVFNANAGTAAIPSLSIGAVSVSAGVLLAGTGDPNDASDSYYGSGLLRSADGGTTWTLVQQSNDGVAGNHSWVGLGFAGFAWSTTTPGLVVAAVSQAAEASLVNAADATNSVMGLYYSTDAGVTWQMSKMTDGSQVVQTPLPGGGNQGGNAATAVVWNAVRQRFIAAVRYHGYYQSADGVNWTRLTAQPGTGLTTTACPTAAKSLACPIFRGALAVQPVTGDTFALTVDANNVDQGLWQDLCASSGSGCSSAITFAQHLGGTALEVGSGSTTIFQGDYNLTLAAAPSTTSGIADTLVYVGTVDVYKCSLAAGCLLRNTTNAVDGCAAPARVSPAQHAIAITNTGTQPLVYLGNDGGIWRSLDGINEQAPVCSADDATHFDNLNSGIGSLAEVVSFAQHPTDTATLLVGLGANGTAGTGTASVTASWGQLAPGEGGYVAIDATNPLLWYASTGAGVSIKACSNGAACTASDFAGTPTIGSAQVSGDESLIDAPWILDPQLPAEMLVATCRVWRGPVAGGSLWSGTNAIAKTFGGSAGSACGTTNPLVRSLAAGGPASSATSAQNAGAQVIYAGMAGTLDGGGNLGGHLFSTAAAGTANSATAWTDLATSPVLNDTASAGKFNPGGFDLSSIAVDPHDATGQTVYATVMGFAGNGTNAPHLYRSVDGGAHWTNISSNLPNAPANSAVVDPNDANTVYVALDTGVYVTTQVANCATTNCWSIYGAGLPNAPVIELAAAVGIPTGDGRTGELRAATYGRGIWQIPLLTAASPAAPAMSVAPTSLTFPLQAAGTASAMQTVTVTNTGNAPLTISQVTATGDFYSTNNCVGTSIAAGASCAVQVSFLPSATGTRTGVLTVYGNVAGGQATVSLSGTGAAGAAVVLNPVMLSFGATTVGATSAAQNVTISNTGGVPSTLGSIAASGDFTVTANTCGATLPAGVGCTVAITFAPTASGLRSGTLTVVDGAGTQTVSLSGTGTSPATDSLSPLSLSFAPQQLNTASTAQQVTLTNAGDVALTLIAAQITAGDFAVVNGCGNSLNAHSSCAMSVTFVPKSVGPGTGVLTVSDQFRSQTVTLNGTGVAPPGVSLSPVSAMTFGVTPVGSSSPAQTVTLTNNGGLPLSVAGVVVTGDFAIVAGSNTCGSTVAVGASCTMQLDFVPTTGGPRNGTITVTDNALSSPQTIALSGTGIDFALAPNGATSVTVPNGTNAVFPLLLSSATNVPGTVTFTCTGVPANAICTVTPTSVALGTTTTVTVTIQTQVNVVSAPRLGEPLYWLASLIPVGLLTIRRRRIAGLLMLLLLAGCGSSRTIPAGGGGSGTGSAPLTPSGSYTIVVSGTSAGLVRVVDLTLVVQ